MALNVEQIDDRIIKLLGFQEGDVLSYEDYYRDLRELIAKHSFGSEKFSADFLAILANERKRIKNNKGIFKISKTKVTSQRKKPTKDSIKKLLNPSGASVNPNANVAKEQVKQTKVTESILDIVISIRESVNKIYESVKLQNKLNKQKV